LTERGKRRLGGSLRRLFLAAPVGASHRLAADEDLDVEAPPVRRPRLSDEPVRRQPAIVSLQPFLQR
jgi:hypothetical protein